jgi:hypothetical protein
VLGEVDLIKGLGFEVGKGEVEGVAGGGESADGGGVGSGLALERGEVAGGDLETAKKQKSAGKLEVAGGDGVDDLGDGELDGLPILKRDEIDAVDGVEGLAGTVAAVTSLEALVVVAEGLSIEGDGAAFVSGGADVTTERGEHRVYPS